MEPQPLSTAMKSSDMTEASSRIEATRVAKIIDEILESSRISHPYSLYRIIGQEAGLHPTTVLRCHRGSLTSAHPALYRVARALMERIRKGQTLPLTERDRPGQVKREAGPGPGRIPAGRVSAEIEFILHLMGHKEHQFLYRYIAEATGIHTTTILRYHTGKLRTAPYPLLEVLIDLRKRLEKGETVPFCRGREGCPVVVREKIVELINAVLKSKLYSSKAELFRRIDRKLDLKTGTTERIYYDRKLRFVPAPVYIELIALSRRMEYEPSAIYEVGDRFKHHLYGLGEVVAKLPKAKILVEFLDQKRQMVLREELKEHPALAQSGHGADFSNRYGICGT